MLKKFLDNGLKVDFSGGLIKNIKSAFGELTNTLKTMQTDLKADALEKIAIAIGVLTASLVVLSMIDSAALTKALTAMGVAFGELVGVLTLIDKLIGSNTAAIKLGIIGAALIEFASAAAILTLAIRNLSGLSWEELSKGLVGVAGGLLVMVAASKLMSDGSLGMIAAGLGMVAISAGLLVLSEAVKSFATMSWGEMAKGLVGVAGGLVLITAAMQLMPAGSVISGLGFIEISAGLVILAGAVKLFGMMDWGEMGKGLLGIAGALLIIAGAMNLMPLSLPITAAGLVILSVALGIMAEAIKAMGNMDLGTLAKGIGGLAAMLLVLVIATNAMNDALPGAAALVVVAAGLEILSKVLITLGEMKTGDIIKGLIALAGVLTVLGLAAAVMEPVIPALLGLGVAIALVGGGMALFGGGIWMLAKGLQTLGEAGADGAKSLVEALKTMSAAIPELLGGLIKGFMDQGVELLKAAPLLVRLITAVLDQLLDTIIQLAPKLGKALIEVLKAALGLIREEYPDYIKTGLEILVKLLEGIRNNIGHITEVVAEIVVNFINALRKKVPDIVDAGYNLMLKVLTTVAEKLGESEFIFIPVAEAFINGFITGFTKYMPGITDFFVGLPGKILGWLGDVTPTLLTKGIDLIVGLITGLVQKAIDLETWWVSLPGVILGWLGDVTPTLLTKGIDIITGFLTGVIQKAGDVETWWVGLPGAILGWLGDVVPTLVAKGVDIITGFLNGVVIKAIELESWWVGLPDAVIGWLGDVVPTLVDKGVDIITGFLNGIVVKVGDVVSWFQDLPGHIQDLLDLIHTLEDKGIDLLTGFLSGITTKFGDITTWALGLADSIKNLVGDSIGWLSQVGIDLIKGLWNGITSMGGWLKDQITGMAGGIIDDFKSGFGILGSPSKHMCDIGQKAGLSLANGLLDMQKPVGDAASGLSDQVIKGFDTDKTVDGINKIFNEIVSQLEGMDEFRPTITPVLDLTHVKMGAKSIDELFNRGVISPVASSTQARTISTTADLAKSAADQAAATGPKEVTFNQYNTSPDALSTGDIYRQTKSQIALAKEELNI
jgi:phage-related protein